ncbi:MAG: hypothetical protein AB2807_05000 [Candidatus Sedimenticola endophacoides]
MADEEQNKDSGAVNEPGEDRAVTTADAGEKAPRKKAAKKKAAPKKKAARKKVAAKSSPVPADAAGAGENTPATPPADAASGAGETPSASVAASSAQKGGEMDTMGGDPAQAVAGEGAALKSRQNERLQEKLREMGIMADESREAPVSPTKHPAPHRPRGMLPQLVLGVLIVVAGFMYIKFVAQKDPSQGVGDSVDVSTGGVMPVTGEGETVESIPLTNPAQEAAREAGDTNASHGTTDGSEIHPEPAPGHTLTISEEQNVTSENGSALSSYSGSGYEGLFRSLELSSPLSGAQAQGGPDTHGQPSIVQRPMIPAPEQGVKDPPSTSAPVREPGAAPEAQPSAVAETATTGGAPEAAQEDSSAEGAGDARAETSTPPGATLPATPYPNYYMGSGRRQATAPERPPWVQERLKRIEAMRQQRRWGYRGAQGPAPSAEPGLPTATYRPRLPGDFYHYGTYPYPCLYPPTPYGYASPPATNNAAGSD